MPSAIGAILCAVATGLLDGPDGLPDGAAGLPDGAASLPGGAASLPGGSASLPDGVTCSVCPPGPGKDVIYTKRQVEDGEISHC